MDDSSTPGEPVPLDGGPLEGESSPLAVTRGAWNAGAAGDAPVVEALAVATVLESPAILPRPGFWLALGVTVLLVVLQGVIGVVAAIMLMVASMVVTGGQPDDSQIAVMLLPVGVTTMLLLSLGAAFLMFGGRTRRVLALRGIAWPQLLIILLATPPFLVVAQEIAACATQYLPSFSAEMFEEFSSLPFALVLLFGGVGPAVGEEIIFRGILGRGLVARYGMLLGGVATALCFGLVHVDPAQAVSVLWLGWILQGVYVATRSLSAPIFMHLLNNMLAFLQMKYYDPFGDLEHMPLALVVAGGLALVGLGILMFQIRSQWVLADGTVWSPGYVTAEMPPAELSAKCQWQRPTTFGMAPAAVTYVIFWAILASVI